MKDRTKLKATHRSIPCFYNQCNEELWGRNKFWDILLSIALWIDVNVFMVDELLLWVEDWK